MRRISIISGLCGAALWTSVASAHISLERGGTHKSRYGDDADSIKSAPCGVAGGQRGSNVYTYEPGQTITVKWVEYVAHPGYFRFAFDADGDDDFKDPESIKPLDPMRGCPATVLSPDAAARDECSKDDFYNSPSVLPEMDDLFPHVEKETNKLYSMDVKLPDIECDNCTLQLIQVMEDPVHGPYNTVVSGQGDVGDVYHQCIDLVLKRSSGTGDMDGAAPAAGAASPQPALQPAAKSDGGCSVARPRAHAATLAWASVPALLCSLRLRRRWRQRQARA